MCYLGYSLWIVSQFILGENFGISASDFLRFINSAPEMKRGIRFMSSLSTRIMQPESLCLNRALVAAPRKSTASTYKLESHDIFHRVIMPCLLLAVNLR